MNRKALAVVALTMLMALAPLASLGAEVSEDHRDGGLAELPAASILVDIAYPRMMRPAFVLSNGSLEVVVSATAPLASAPNVTLMPGGHTCTAEVISWDGCNATLDVKIPALPDGNYDLVVDDGGISFSQTRAVSVKEHFGDDYRFIHLTDLHIGKEGSAERFPELRQKVGLLNPDFVVIGGDLIDANMGGDSYSETLLMLELFQDFPCPTFAAPGNHEYGYIFSSGSGIQDYLELVNPVLDYSFQYGNDTFVMLNTGKYATILSVMGMEVPDPNNNVTGLTDSQIDWLKDTFEMAPAGNRFIVTHAPLVNTDEGNMQTPDSNRLEAIEVAGHYGVDAILSGHTHYDKLFDGTGVRQSGSWKEPVKPWHVQTTSALVNEGETFRTLDEREVGFREVRVSGDDIELTEDANGDCIPDADEPIALSDIAIDELDDSAVAITNHLGRPIVDGRVVVNTTANLSMPEVFGGLLEELTIGNGWMSADVSVSLAPGTTTVVKFTDADYAPRLLGMEEIDAYTIRATFDKGMMLPPTGCYELTDYSATTHVPLTAARHNWSSFDMRREDGLPMSHELTEIIYLGGITDFVGRPLSEGWWGDEADWYLPFYSSIVPSIESFDAPDPFNPLTDSIEIRFSDVMLASSMEQAISTVPWIPFTLGMDYVSLDATLSFGGFTTADTPSEIVIHISGACDIRGNVMPDEEFHLTVVDDLAPPLLLDAETLTNGTVRFVFSEPVSGVASALSPACTMFVLSPTVYLASPMISVPDITLDPSKVTDLAGNALDTDMDGVPGGPVVDTPVRIPATTGAVEGACPGSHVTLASGMMFRRVEAVGGRYYASGLAPGVWLVSSGNATRSVVVTVGGTTVVNLAEGVEPVATGAVAVICPEGIVRIGSLTRHVEGGTSTTFTGISPGEYMVTFEDEGGVRTTSVVVEPGETADCAFEVRDESSAFSLEYVVAGVIVLALAALAVSFFVFKGGDGSE